MAYIDTLTLLAGVKAALEALTIDKAGHPLLGQPLFEKVEYFDTPETGTAMRQLLLTEGRVCFLVPSGDDYENVITGGVLISSCGQEFDLIFADRAWVEGNDAVFGGGDNVGVIPMKDQVRRGLVGQNLGIDGVALVPLSGSFLTIKDAEAAKDTPGRESYLMTWTTWSGEERISVSV